MSKLLLFQSFAATENLIDMQVLTLTIVFSLWCLENAPKKFERQNDYYRLSTVKSAKGEAMFLSEQLHD